MDEKRNKILASAEQLFAQFGFLKTTMEDIAKKAHMAKSSVYYYFKSKKEIFAEVIRQDTLVFQQKLESAVAAVDTPEAKIRAYVTTRDETPGGISVNFI